MIQFLFTRKFNRWDILPFCFFFKLTSLDYWGWAFLALFIGSVVSVIGEDALEKRA